MDQVKIDQSISLLCEMLETMENSLSFAKSQKKYQNRNASEFTDMEKRCMEKIIKINNSINFLGSLKVKEPE